MIKKTAQNLIKIEFYCQNLSVITKKKKTKDFIMQ